jgi:phospholipid/cholesterol/gamma-HCH transport system permease protein
MPAAALAISDLPDGRRVVALDGRLDASTVRDLWEPAHRAVTEAPSRPVVVDAGKVDYCDNAGVALLVDLVAQKREAPVEVANLKPSIQALYRPVRSAARHAGPRPRAEAAPRDRGARPRRVRRRGRTSPS